MAVDQAAGLRRDVQRAQRQGWRGAFTQSARPSPRLRRGLYQVALASGRAGVGKTMLAVNLAVALVLARQRVLAVDASAGARSIGDLLGVIAGCSLADVAAGRLSLEQAISSGPAGVGVLIAAEVARRYPSDAIVRALAEVAPSTDCVVVDVGPGSGDLRRFWADVVDEVIMVTTPDPATVAETYAVIKALCQRSVRPRIGLVVNQVVAAGETAVVESALVDVTLRLLGAVVRSYGGIPSDEALRRASQERVPAVLSWPRSPSSLAIRGVAQALAGSREEDG